MYRSCSLPFGKSKCHLSHWCHLRLIYINSVRNASIDYLKHKDVEFDYLQKIIESHQAYSIGDDEEDGFFTEEIFRQLFMTIDSLPERCRQVFLLYMEGKKNEEIAAVLCVSLETVKTQKKRASLFLGKN